MSVAHINNDSSLKHINDYAILRHVNEANKIAIEQHNARVTKNRKILSIIVDSIFLCGFHEKSLRGHDESFDSYNPGLFRGLLKWACKLDKDVHDHFHSSSVFKGHSKTIQNEIIDCALQIYREQIVAEVAEAPFVAVMADDTTDIADTVQTVIVIRYIHKGKVVERFCFFLIQSEPMQINCPD